MALLTKSRALIWNLAVLFLPLVGCINGSFNTVSSSASTTRYFLYVTNYGANTLTPFSINKNTGTLVAGPVVSIPGTGPRAVTGDPLGQALFVTSDSGLVTSFTVNATTGALTQVSSVNVSSSCTLPQNLVTDSLSHYLYVICTGSNNGLIGFYVSNGNLMSMGAPFFTGGSPLGILMDPLGGYVFSVVPGAPNVLKAFAVFPSTLTLSTQVNMAASPTSLTSNKLASYLYAGESSVTNNLEWFLLTRSTPALSSSGSVTVVAGQSTTFVTGNPIYNQIYALTSGTSQITSYQSDPTTGALTSPLVTTGASSPQTMVVDPSGSYAYVTGINATTDVTVFRIDSTTGNLVNLGSITSGTQAMGSFVLKTVTYP